jgi:hypothetical protein
MHADRDGFKALEEGIRIHVKFGFEFLGKLVIRLDLRIRRLIHGSRL